MKKILLTLSIVIISACTPISENKKYDDINNHQFIKILKSYQSFSGNDIQENEALKRRDAQLRENLDTCGVYNNVKCKMNGLALRDFGDFKIIDFKIKVEVNKDFYIDLDCIHAIHKNNLDNDYLYNKFKDISSYASVYVDGVISYDIEKDMLKKSGYSESLVFAFPDYNFHVVDISKTKLDTVSDNLKSALIAARQSFYMACKKVRGDKDFSRREFNKSISDYNGKIKILNDKEKEYAERYKDYIEKDLFK